MQQEIIQGYRLSQQQKHLWLLHRDLVDNVAYRAICVVRITGELDTDLLERALDQVVARQEILRTTFRMLHGMTIPIQVIDAEGRAGFVIHDLTSLGDIEQLSRVDQLIFEATSGGVDYEHLPLLRASLVKQSSKSHQLILTAPALCADALSLQRLLLQIADAYGQSQAADASDTDAMQYADFAEWQNDLLETEEATIAKQYWRDQDLSPLATQRLLFEKRLSFEERFRPATMKVDVSLETASRVRAIANRLDVSLSSFGLAGLQVLISRLTGRSNTVLGAGVDGRKFGELEDAIGLFSRFLPMRRDLDASLSFERVWKQASDQEQELKKWQEYFSWDDVASKDKTRFFPFCYEFRTQPPTYRTAGLEFSIYKLDACSDRFSIKFILEDQDDQFSASLQFDESLFLIQDVRRMAGQLKALIEDSAIRPEVAVGELELLSAGDHELSLVQFNDTQRQYSGAQTVHELFEEQASQRLNDVAVIYEDERLTYGQLNTRANQLAHHLARFHVAPDVTVGLYLNRSVDLIVGLLGILKSGGAYVPLDPGLPKARIGMLLEEAGARVVVTTSQLTEALPEGLDIVRLDADASIIATERLDQPLGTVSGENLAYVIFTSGSTGRPKGVAVEHRQLVNYLQAIWENLDLPDRSSFATVSTIAADLGNTALFPSLCKGGTLHLIAEERATDPKALGEYYSRNRIDCLKIVPTHVSALLSASNPVDVLPRRRLILGGEACTWSLAEKIRTLSADCVVLNHYGPTEATVGAITNRLSEDDTTLMSDTVPLGRPLANVLAYVLDRHLRPAPVGGPGELHIGGAGLARGYINRADATAEKFIPNPFRSGGERLYKTGDLARYLGDGRIEFLGRIDDQTKIHGYRVEPGEIEIVLRKHPVVAESVVLARDDDHGNRRLVAYVVTGESESVSAHDLRGFLKGRLPEYMIPSGFVFLDRLPLTPNGKVDRRALSTLDYSRLAGDRVFVPPRNQVEETLATIWSNVLNVKAVGVNDNFFDLGGDSILSIQIVARANQAGLGLTPRQIFEHQTVAELATVAGIDAQTIAEQGSVTGRVPLTPVQARFFELDQSELHHYNQAMLLEVHGTADASLFAKAFEQLLLQHDALRFRYERKNDSWEQRIATPDGVAPLETVDLSATAEAEQRRMISDHARRLQASLNLHDGPLMRVALFERGSQRNSFLLIVIHHLAVDGVSWRILLEDLQTLYRQFSNREQPSLPPKTTSFKSWAERLTEHARSAALLDELDHWCLKGANHGARLPVDYPGKRNTAASARTVSSSLNADETRTLLQNVPTAFRTQINEVLLTALVRAVTPWTGSNSLLIDLEGHGREEILEGVDLSRTVGWFTTIFPILLNCTDSQTPIEVLRSVKEQLRGILNRGIGYGLLRYTNDATSEKLRALPQAEMRLNYLGQVDRALLDSSMFTVVSQPIGPAQSPKAQRGYLINIIGSVTGGELHLDWTYSENVHRRETVEHLSQNYLHELRMLIAESRSDNEISYSPSDFPNAKLSQEDLNKVLARLGRVKE